MTPNQKLRVDADRCREAFFQTVSSLSEQMRPAAVLDKVVGDLDPGFEVLKRLDSTAKRNPLAVLVAVGGLWLLVQQMKRIGQQTKPAIRRGMRPYRAARSTLKGDENGYINDAEQY